MAIMKCRECLGQVSDQAGACPHCGAPIKSADTPRVFMVAQNKPTKVGNAFIGLVVVSVISWATWSALHLPEEVIEPIVTAPSKPISQYGTPVPDASNGSKMEFLVNEFYRFEAECKGSPDAQGACNERDSFGDKLRVAGWCLEGPNRDSSNAEMTWQKCKFNKVENSPGNNPQPTVVSIPALKIHATRLIEEYKANEIAADTKYKGQNLIVTGVLSSINKDFMGDPYLILTAGDAFDSVHANFPKGAMSELSSLQKGQVIVIRCTGRGMILSSPILHECSLKS